MKNYIYFTLILMFSTFHLYSQVGEEKTIMDMETEEIIIKITSDYNLTKTIYINLEVKHNILIPILYKTNFIIDSRLLSDNILFLCFPFDLNYTAMDIEVDYKIIYAGTKINEKIALKDLVNPVDLYFSYSYINDTTSFDKIINRKSLYNYTLNMKWGTMKFKSNL